MEKSRLEILEEMVAAKPEDSFSRYGLAQEHLRRGEPDKAVGQFLELLRVNPDYEAAYYHGGQALEKLGRLDGARQLYSRGVEAASRTGNQHARSELQAALDLLPPELT